ncbi:MAG TPA: hypothetical protein VFL57_15625, partial [Bryobacteraceae bacterium]|nr:hypothetical protein [Bryobacteraceae bacterium]
MNLRSLLAAAFTAGLLIAAIDYEAEGTRWWKHVEYLASDKLEGRNTGSPGHRKAAEYVAAEFERAGLKPAGTQAFFQPVAFRSRQIDEDKSSLSLVGADGKAQPLTLGQDAYFSV